MQDDPPILSLLRHGLRDAVVVIVGGTGGIGNAVATQALALGARIIRGARTAPDNAGDGRDITLPIDVTDSASIKAFAAAVEDRAGRIDILVNSAGLSFQVPPGRLDLLTDDIVDAVLDSNARGALLVMRDMAPLLRRGTNPVIVNISSIAARTGGGSNIAYAGAKAALDTMTIGMAKALAPQIRVLNISPSALETDFVRDRKPDFLEATAAASALKRLASLEEVATAVLVAARLLTASTGISIPVDAGRHL